MAPRGSIANANFEENEDDKSIGSKVAGLGNMILGTAVSTVHTRTFTMNQFGRCLRLILTSKATCPFWHSHFRQQRRTRMLPIAQCQ
jgi:hypothetical protein